MTQNFDCSFRVGDSITFEAVNKPFLPDVGVPPESNDTLWADKAVIRIYSPNNNCPRPLPSDDWTLEHEGPLNINTAKVGWYWYRFQTSTDDAIGLWRVEIELTTCLPAGTPSTESPCLTGGSELSDSVPSSGGGSSGNVELVDQCRAISVHYFRLLPRGNN